MSDKMQGGILAGSTSVSVPVILRKTADNTELTGIAAAGVTAAYYWRQGGTPTALMALSDLAAITSAFSAGGWKEADATHQPGAYRLDVDNAAFATGADWVIIGVKVASAYVFYEKYALTTNVIQTGDSFGVVKSGGTGDTAAIKAKTDSLTFTAAGKVDANALAINGVATTSVSAINANLGTTQPINFHGTGATAYVKADMVESLDVAVTLDANSVLNVSTKYLAGTSQTGRDIGASVLLSAGTGTGQLDFTSGVVKANHVQELGTALTETLAGNLAAAYKKFFDVSAPVFTTAGVNQTGDSYAALTGATTEPTTPPSATASILDKIKWLFCLGKNKRTQTSTTELVRNDADGATIGTATKSDDGTTFTRGKFS